MSLPTSAPCEPDNTTMLAAVSLATATVRSPAAAAAAAHAAHIRARTGTETGLVPAIIAVNRIESAKDAHHVIRLAGRKIVAAGAAASAADEAWLLAELRHDSFGLRLELADSGSSGGLDSVREILHPAKVQCGLARTGPGGHLVLAVYVGGAAGLALVRTTHSGMQLVNLLLDVFPPGGFMSPALTQFTHRLVEIGRATALADIDAGVTVREACTGEILEKENGKDWEEWQRMLVTIEDDEEDYEAECAKEAETIAKKRARARKSRGGLGLPLSMRD